MRPVIRAMVGFQRLTGCRPDEVCRLRPIDLDRKNPVCWVYRPGSDQGQHGQHKTAHHGHERLILIGPKAQKVLTPYLDVEPNAYCFSPVESERQRSDDRRDARQSPMTPSQSARKPQARRKRAPRDHYDETSYRNAVYRACDRAFPLPANLAPRLLDNSKRESRAAWWTRLTNAEKGEVRSWRKNHRWHPNQLRHSRATDLRPFGLDVAKTVLGHTRVETTLIYAEKDLAAAMEVVSKVG
jgi:integrase